ncbi:MAG: PIN domain-containing protein [Opitutaceae bacterium]|nr:PIN domain-containing protein [Opitutaceae bacterium]
MLTHVFDTSAVLAHFYQESGAETANALLTDTHAHIGITAVSLLELRSTILRSVVGASPELRRNAEAAYRLYADELLETVPVTRPLVEEAARLLDDPKGPLTESQAVSAAAARLHDAILVHTSYPPGTLNGLRSLQL